MGKWDKQIIGKKDVGIITLAPTPPKPLSTLLAFERKDTQTLGDDVEGPTATDIDFEWKPEKEGEQIEGQILTINRMGLGGRAVTLHLADPSWIMQYHDNKKPVIVLFKGGAWFEVRAEGFAPPLAAGDFVRIRFDGLEPAKQPGFNPGRKFSIGRRKTL